MKILASSLFLALLLFPMQYTVAQVSANAPLDSVLADGLDLPAAQVEVDELIASRQFDRIITVIIRSPLTIAGYCFKRIGTLGKLEQAGIISSLLLDRHVFPTEDDLPNPATIQKQDRLQSMTLQLAYQLLGEQRPPYKGYVYSIEASALAARLRAKVKGVSSEWH